LKQVKLRRWGRQNIISSVGILLALLIAIACLLAPVIAPYEPAHQDLSIGLSGFSWEHLLGTDQLGRDLLSRLLWAGRTSITLTIIVLSLSLILGGGVGVCAGYFGGLVDEVLMRLVDLFLSLPKLILALALVGALGSGFLDLVAALTVVWWSTYARLIRSQVLAVKNEEFFLAAKALGGSPIHIIRAHLLPALLGPVLVQLSLDAGAIVLTIAGLSFLGLGIQPPSPEWGTMLVDARPFMEVAPRLVILPGAVITIAVFGFNALAEGLETWLDPRIVS
jgi:peptide/nickel transport system permease protein